MRSRLAAIPALLLVVVAVWEIVATRSQAASVPGDPAWDRAAQLVRAKHQRGDLIVFAPGWADPIGRLHLGDLIPLAMAGRMDAARYGRIWELSIRGAGSPEVAGLAPVEETVVDGVTVRRFERAPAIVLADLRDQKPTVDGGTARVDLVEVAFEPHRCLIVPVGNGTPVTVTYPNVTLGSELVGYLGIADVFTRRENREPIELAVEVSSGHDEPTIVTAPIDRWVPFRVPTTPGSAHVRFTLQWSAPKPGGSKQVCFAAEARK
jgi:hypothetical protein